MLPKLSQRFNFERVLYSDIADPVLEAFRHVGKAGHCPVDEILAHNLLQLRLGCKVGLMNLESLFKWSELKFDQVLLVPFEDRDLTFWVGYFADDAHKYKYPTTEAISLHDSLVTACSSYL